MDDGVDVVVVGILGTKKRTLRGAGIPKNLMTTSAGALWYENWTSVHSWLIAAMPMAGNPVDVVLVVLWKMKNEEIQGIPDFKNRK